VPDPSPLTNILAGFRHIVPEGLDHILFVLGICLLARSIPPIIWQITTFTLGHSLTLALSVQGFLSLPPTAVEIAIGLSIAWIAVENLWQRNLPPWRLLVIFGFGLVHGLGFAHASGSSGLELRSLSALVCFNFGIELGQLVVVLAAILLTAAYWQRPCYHERVVRPISVLIALTGLGMAIWRSIAMVL
jgi:hypothetical protein